MKKGGRGAKKVNLENWENLEKGGAGWVYLSY
jgi:hypothetical protein